MTARTCLIIVLAAGEGTRMRSARPKVLHAIGGKTLIAHVLAAAAAADGGGATAVVVGPGQEDYDQNKILTTSPIGQGLIGKKPGEIAEIQVPMGKVRFQILDISYP